jgi:hypothetical protein
MSVAAAAKAVKMQQPNLTAVENGRKRITEENLVKLGQLYEVDADELKELDLLRVGADRNDWYLSYAWLITDEFLRYLGLEAGASDIFVYQSSLVHGLLQTKEYAEAVIRGGAPYIRLTEVQPRIEVRLTRQQRLDHVDPLRVSALLTEAVLRQEIGGREVMRQQLAHLVRLMTENPHVTIQVLPFSVGAYAALGGPFSILSFDSPYLPAVAWQETLTPAAFYERAPQVREYTVALAETQNLALSAEDSLEFIREVAKEMA